MGSSRLPGKIMRTVCGKPFLEHMISRIKYSKTLETISIATTTNEKDDEIVKLCNKINVKYYRGSEEDVLSRYKAASDEINADVIVRLTSDTPIMDYHVIDKVVKIYSENNYDFVSNCYPMPRTYPDGMNVEVFSAKMLDETFRESKKPSEREHVTFFMWMNTNRYKIFRVDYDRDVSMYRFNLDYPEDHTVLKSIFDGLYPKNPMFTMEDAIKWLDENPHIFKINSHIKPGSGFMKSLDSDKKAGFEVNQKGLF